MNNQSSLSRYILVILCVSIVFTALVLIALNSLMQNQKLSGLRSGIPAVDQVLTGQSYEDGYRAGYTAAREKFRNIPPGDAQSPIHTLIGTIESIKGNEITIKANNLDVDEIVDGIGNKRKVTISTTTSIMIRTEKDLTAFSNEFAAWNKSPEKGNPPVSFTETKLSLADLKVGQIINVDAKEDIRLKESFTALRVYYNQTQDPEILKR